MLKQCVFSHNLRGSLDCGACFISPSPTPVDDFPSNYASIPAEYAMKKLAKPDIGRASTLFFEFNLVRS